MVGVLMVLVGFAMLYFGVFGKVPQAMDAFRIGTTSSANGVGVGAHL